MFWKKKTYDIDENTTLTKADRTDIAYKFFVASAVLTCIVIISTSLSLGFSYKREAKDMENVLNTIYAYMATATKDEYDDIAAEIRNDLVLHTYDDSQWKYIELIPNTSEKCRLEMTSFPCQAYLVATNNGQLYSLDIYQDGHTPDEKIGSMSMSFGYDELSETSLQIISKPDNQEAKATIDSDRGIVSVHRMKTLFCDDCIKQILETNKNVLAPEFILFDSAAHAWYPIENGKNYQIGDYALDIEYSEWSTYEIQIKYTGQ